MVGVLKRAWQGITRKHSDEGCYRQPNGSVYEHRSKYVFLSWIEINLDVSTRGLEAMPSPELSRLEVGFIPKKETFSIFMPLGNVVREPGRSSASPADIQVTNMYVRKVLKKL